jgi:hypothetical protein
VVLATSVARMTSEHNEYQWFMRSHITVHFSSLVLVSFMFRMVKIYAKAFPILRLESFTLQSNVAPVASYEIEGRASILGRVRHSSLRSI